MDDDELLSSRAVRQFLNVSPTTLWRMRRDGIGPRPVHVGKPDAVRKTYRYRKSELAAWLTGDRDD